ncbi:MAG: translation initiation factor IF-2 [Acidobacteria bacterium]|nr:translation initiation factor IF-2 [Acidobacteriota bacterium]
MGKIRVYELAKQLKLEPKKVIEDARRMGIDVTVPSNSISEQEAERIRSKYFAKKEEPKRPKVVLVKKAKEVVAAEEGPVAPAPTEQEPPAPSAVGAPKRPEIEAAPQPDVDWIEHAPKVKTIPLKKKPVAVEPEPPAVKVTPLKLVQPPVPPRPSPPPVQPVAHAPQPKVVEEPVKPEIEEKPKLPAKTQVRVLRPSTALQTQAPARAGEVAEGVYVPPRDDRRRRRRPMRPIVKKRVITEEQPMVATAVAEPVVTELRTVKLMEGVSVKELSEKLDLRPRDVMRKLLERGVMATINQSLDPEVAREIGREFGYDVHFASFEELAEEAVIERLIEAGEEEVLVSRAPVVTVMGHVDHGKTSLLDAIRQTAVAESEAGGITQHIGAYTAQVPDPDNSTQKREIVFLDTPGHEAFTMMRARGAQVTDIVVLVVAADDGVMPQTIEAIEHARAANVPIIVAINKIDKPEANVERVKRELADQGLVWEGWGGDTVMVEVSAKKRINLDGLLEMILLTADILDLKANPERNAMGVVLESRLDRGRGPVATILVEQGTLQTGNAFLVGSTFGRVRAMFDYRGKHLSEAPPATPVEITGLEVVPEAGDKLVVVEDLTTAQRISSMRQTAQRQARVAMSAATSLEQLYERMRTGELRELQLILKADVQGSLEALRATLEKLSSPKVKVRVIRSGVGAITESDILLAAASNQMERSAVIIGFNVRPEPRAMELARQENVDIRFHSIIYKVEEEIRNAMLGLLEPTEKEVRLGQAEVRQVFHVAKVGNVAGCMVTEGIVRRKSQARLIRDNVVIYQGAIQSLRRFKEDVAEVREGFECGISLENYSDIKPGDVIEAFTVEKVAQTL